METKQDVTEVKSINGLTKQDLTHVGDLIINGDVGMCALTVKNGTLTINGKVKEGANIMCSDPDARTKTVSTNGGRHSTIQIGSEKINFSSSSYDYKGSYYINASIVTPHVSIDTPDRLEKREEKHPYGWVLNTSYLVTSQTGYGQAKAVVNGKLYSGTSIEVSSDGTVYAKGAPSSDNDSKPKLPCKLILNGDIEDSVVIQFDTLEFNGNVGNFCTITSHEGGFTAKNIGEGTKINVKGKIQVASVGKNVELKTDSSVSAMDIGELATILSHATVHVGKVGNGATIKSDKDITADSLESNSKLTSVYESIEIKGNANEKVKLKANKSVHCMDIGNESSITSEYGGLRVKKIGSGSTLQAHKDIVAGDVGANSDLTSAYGSIEITGAVHREVNIKANKDVTCQNISKNASITSEYSKIRVKNVGSGVTIEANKDITAGKVGSKSTLSSTYGQIEITGRCKNHVKIKANKAITCQDVGEKSQLLSEYGAVKVNNLESGVAIKASKAIDVKGYCPTDTRLKSEYGKVTKNTNAQKPEPVAKKVINQASNQQGFFSTQKTEKKAESEKEFPAEFYCWITKEIMQNPVICMDGNTYEEAAIKDWLQDNDTSPKTNQPLASKLLVPNNSLHTMIQEALEKNRTMTI